MPELLTTNEEKYATVVEDGTDPLRPKTFIDRFYGIDPLTLRRASVILTLLTMLSISLITGTKDVSAQGLEGQYINSDTSSTLIGSLLSKAGELLGNISATLPDNISDLTNGAFQDLPDGDIVAEIFEKVVVDGAEAVVNIYEEGSIFAKSRPRLTAALLSGGIHALFRIKELAYFLRNGYEYIVDPSMDWDAINSGVSPEKKPLKQKVFDSMNPINIAKAFIIPSHFIDTWFTAMTVANFTPTPANLLNLAMLGVKYKITDMGYKNMMKLEDLIKKKKALEEMGQTISTRDMMKFIFLAYPVYWSIAGLDATVDIILFVKWAGGEPLEQEFIDNAP